MQHGILERSGLFGESFTEAAKQRFARYYPIEVDPDLDFHTKKAKMQVSSLEEISTRPAFTLSAVRNGHEHQVL